MSRKIAQCESPLVKTVSPSFSAAACTVCLASPWRHKSIDSTSVWQRVQEYLTIFLIGRSYQPSSFGEFKPASKRLFHCVRQHADFVSTYLLSCHGVSHSSVSSQTWHQFFLSFSFSLFLSFSFLFYSFFSRHHANTQIRRCFFTAFGIVNSIGMLLVNFHTANHATSDALKSAQLNKTRHEQKPKRRKTNTKQSNNHKPRRKAKRITAKTEKETLAHLNY